MTKAETGKPFSWKKFYVCIERTVRFKGKSLSHYNFVSIFLVDV